MQINYLGELSDEWYTQNGKVPFFSIHQCAESVTSLTQSSQPILSFFYVSRAAFYNTTKRTCDH